MSEGAREHRKTTYKDHSEEELELVLEDLRDHVVVGQRVRAVQFVFGPQFDVGPVDW
jgi:hypothetical protein